MVIFSWIVLGFAAFLLVCSGISRAVYVANEDSDWRRLSVKLFRFSMVLVLLFINTYIWGHVIDGLMS